MADVDTSAQAVKRLADDLQDIRWPAYQGSKLREDAAHTLRALLAERDRAVEARTVAVREMAAMARQAGSWQGIAEGKDAIIRQVEAERDALRAALLFYGGHDPDNSDHGAWVERMNEDGGDVARAALTGSNGNG